MQSHGDNSVEVQGEEELIQCNFCANRAEFLCGKCQEIGYCKPEHQKADWLGHRNVCVSVAEKAVTHNRKRLSIRAAMIEHMAEARFYEASDCGFRILELERKFCEANPSLRNELEYGSTVVLLTRVWIYYKDFNKALDVLNSYLQVKMPFIRATGHLPLARPGHDLGAQDIELIQQKLSLISAIAVVSHELVRNALDILEILINHFQKIYGPASLELSSIYFYVGNYLDFLNQPNKAFACFLKAAKLRGEKCTTSYFNAALICIGSKHHSLALDLLLMAAGSLSENELSRHPELLIQICEAQAYVYKHLNNAPKAIASLEAALCLRESTRSPEVKLVERDKLLLAIIKAEREAQESEMKQLMLPREKHPIKKLIQISSEDYRNLAQAGKAEQDEEQQNEDWVESFNEFKKRLKTVSPIPQVPFVAAEKLLGKDKQEFVREEEIPSFTKNKDRFSEEKVNVSIELISKLTSSEMDFLNELNRLLSECKEKSAIIDIFENSNLYQTISSEKLDLLYALNPKFLRARDINSRKIRIIDDYTAEDANESFSKEYMKRSAKSPSKKHKLVTPRLKLENLPKKY